MSKTLKDLNWSLLLVNILGAICVGVTIAYAADMSLNGYLATIGLCVAKDAGSFFSDCKKQLSE